MSPGRHSAVTTQVDFPFTHCLRVPSQMSIVVLEQSVPVCLIVCPLQKYASVHVTLIDWQDDFPSIQVCVIPLQVSPVVVVQSDF